MPCQTGVTFSFNSPLVTGRVIFTSVIQQSKMLSKLFTIISHGSQKMPNKIKKTQPETPYVPQGRDLFQTPYYATELLIPFIPKRIRWIWEPACGKGKISD